MLCTTAAVDKTSSKKTAQNPPKAFTALSLRNQTIIIIIEKTDAGQFPSLHDSLISRLRIK